jgi:hypothetical protein
MPQKIFYRNIGNTGLGQCFMEYLCTYIHRVTFSSSLHYDKMCMTTHFAAEKYQFDEFNKHTEKKKIMEDK